MAQLISFIMLLDSTPAWARLAILAPTCYAHTHAQVRALARAYGWGERA